jgi:ApaG protein
MLTYRTSTDDLVVTVRPCYLDDPSDPIEKRFAFGLSVEVRNRHSSDIRLIRGEWRIENAEDHPPGGRTRTIERNNALIRSGERQRWTTSCVISTFRGAIKGQLFFEGPDGRRLRAEAPMVPLRASVN